jgi:hypothetical protein
VARGFGTADRAEIIYVDKFEVKTPETSFHGLQDQIGTRSDDKGIPGTVLEHVPQESLVVAFGITAGGVDVDDPFVQSRSDEIDSIAGSHADNGKVEACLPQGTIHDLPIF